VARGSIAVEGAAAMRRPLHGCRPRAVATIASDRGIAPCALVELWASMDIYLGIAAVLTVVLVACLALIITRGMS
jgi:hypothetical protein